MMDAAFRVECDRRHHELSAVLLRRLVLLARAAAIFAIVAAVLAKHGTLAYAALALLMAVEMLDLDRRVIQRHRQAAGALAELLDQAHDADTLLLQADHVIATAPAGVAALRTIAHNDTVRRRVYSMPMPSSGLSRLLALLTAEIHFGRRRPSRMALLLQTRRLQPPQENRSAKRTW